MCYSVKVEALSAIYCVSVTSRAADILLLDDHHSNFGRICRVLVLASPTFHGNRRVKLMVGRCVHPVTLESDWTGLDSTRLCWCVRTLSVTALTSPTGEGSSVICKSAPSSDVVFREGCNIRRPIASRRAYKWTYLRPASFVNTKNQFVNILELTGSFLRYAFNYIGTSYFCSILFVAFCRLAYHKPRRSVALQHARWNIVGV
jgi:hypothetical protein